jgi:hypothetical protein
MHRHLALVVVLAAALCLSLLTEGAIANHVACGDVITQDTTLDSDLLSCPSDGVVIGAPHVTIDLAGHVIDGPDPPVSCCDDGPDGVNNRAGHDHVTIRNGTIREFQHGVSIGGHRPGISRSPSTGNVVRDLVISSNRGIAASEAGDVLLERNSLVTRTFAIAFLNVSLGTIRRNVTDSIPPLGHGAALIVQSAAGGSAHDNLVERNTVTHGDIDVFGNANVVVANEVSLGLDAGIGVLGTGTVVAKNLVRGNTAGIVVFGDHRIEKNELVGNGSDGIRVETGQSELVHNVARGNGDDGIEVESPGTRVAKNTADGNGDLGIFAVPGVIDGGGNKAAGNGDPLQCLNVFCK